MSLRNKIYYTLPRLTAVFVILVFQTTARAQAPVANFTGSPLSGCSPVIVIFQNLSTGNPTSFSWDFGNGNTSTLQNPTATYFTPGSYTVKLTATNANGSNTLTRTQYVNVYEAPNVNFTANITSGCFPLHVQFTDLSTPGAGNTNTSWQWDFGNGITSTVRNPSITYTTSGIFTVTLKVTNDKGCSKTYSRANYITVSPGVNAGFTHTQPTVCRPPANVSFTNTSTGPGTLSYFWMFGDGGTSTVQNPVYTYNTSGNFTVTLVTTSSSGCTDTVRTTVPIVIGGITTSFVGPSSICVNGSATFTNTSFPGPTSVLWTFGDGNSSTSVNSATNTYTVPGVYTVKLYNTYANCMDSASQTVTVNALPVADFTSPDTVKCQPPLTSNFQDLTPGATSWQWNFGDGGTSTLQNPSHTYTNYGTYNVTLIVTNGAGCTDTIVKPNFIKIRRAQISIPGLPANGCIPFTINPVATINSLDAVTSWYWIFGDGGTSTLQNPSHTYVAQGTYTVSLIITTSGGCTDTLTIPQAVKVGSKPMANFSAAPIPQCAFQAVQFTDMSVPADQWLWNFGDGNISTAQNPTHAYGMPGVYTVTLIAFNNGCGDTLIRPNYVSILPPVAEFSATANCSRRKEFQFTDMSIGPLTWSWDFGDGNTSTLQNPLHTYAAFGTYMVTLTVTNGSCSHTVTHTVQALDQTPDFNANQTTGCKSAFMFFTATNISLPATSNYFWDFGDGTQQNTAVAAIGHLYSNAGTYTVMMVTTDLNGCRDTVIKTNYIRVNGPLANFTASNVIGCTGLTTTFNDLSTTDGVNNIVNWQWNFGDGVIQNLSGPPHQHVYNTPGIFSVKLIITDAAGCKDSTTLNNIVTTTDPVPNFTSADTLTCPGATVTFTNTSVATGFTNSWNFGDGNTSTLLSPTHVYTATGYYTVKLRIQDTIGCADSITKNLYIRVDKPIANFTRDDSASSCTPLEVQFTNTSTYYASVIWDFGPGGTSTLNNPIHYYTAPGIYNVKLIAISPGGCRDSIYKTVTVYDTAGANITYQPLSGCKPLSASFSAFSQGPMGSYLWDFGDGTTATTTTPNVTHIFNSFGSFTPKLIMQDPAGCYIPVGGVDSIYVTGAKANFGYDDSLFCDYGFVNFIDSTTFNETVTSYSWLFGDGGSSTLQNPSHQYLAPGNYNVQLAVQTVSGCRDTLTKPNAIMVVRRPLIDIAGDTVVCVNSSLLQSGIFIQPDTSQVNWSWNFPNGNTSNQQNPGPQIYSSVGSFTVTAVATNSSGCKDTTTQNILVNPLPVVNMPGQMTVQAGFPVTIPATYTPNTVNWSWAPPTGLSCTNCPTPDAGPRFNTVYRVDFTDSNGCTNRGFITVIVICKNANVFIPNTFSPNGDGSNDRFYPRGTGLDRVKLIRIFNRWGEIVFEKKDFPINDALSGWDGTYKGNKAKADVYVYQLEVFCENGDLIRLNGNIALIL